MTATLAIRPWPDPVIDTLGHDPRSLYVERFWLPTLGPTSLLLLRRIAAGLDEHPEGIQLDLGELSQALGLGHAKATRRRCVRSLDRLIQFDLACGEREHGYAVRRTVPPVNRRHVGRLPAPLQDEHRAWAERALAEPPLAHRPPPGPAARVHAARAGRRPRPRRARRCTTSASTRRSAARARRGRTSVTAPRFEEAVAAGFDPAA